MAFTKEQPKDGDTIMHCGHVVGCMHRFQYEKSIGFERHDGTHGEAAWFQRRQEHEHEVHVLLAVEDCDEKHVSCVWFGIDGSARWTGPYRRRFRRSEFELVQAPRGRRLSR